jgi:hypothetical protein
MKALGYPVTWRTRCFISGGCGQTVFAHTNGYGDFVLFDRLGYPWLIHGCYSLRFLEQEYESISERRIIPQALNQYRKAEDPNPQAPKPKPIILEPNNIKKIFPIRYAEKKNIEITGYIQDHFKKHAEKEMAKMMALQKREFIDKIDKRLDQITIVSSELKSYTAYINLDRGKIKNKDIIAARLQTRKLILSPGDYIFLCDDFVIFSK